MLKANPRSGSCLGTRSNRFLTKWQFWCVWPRFSLWNCYNNHVAIMLHSENFLHPGLHLMRDLIATRRNSLYDAVQSICYCHDPPVVLGMSALGNPPKTDQWQNFTHSVLSIIFHERKPMRTRQIILNTLFAIALAVGLVPIAMPMESASAATPTELFFSEYI